MAPSTSTQTTVIEKIDAGCVEYQLRNKTKALNLMSYDNISADDNNNTPNEPKLHFSYYDQVLPNNEGYLLSYVRQWEKAVGFETPIRWNNTIGIILFHLLTVIGCTVSIFTTESCPKWQTVIYTVMLGCMSGVGVTAGAHRYWCHKSYKAKWPLQVILLLCYSVAGQNNIYQWVRDHRVHHKFSETSADPHNANRGFFFSHVGWLMMKKHPDVIREGRKTDMSDILQDPLVRFHIKYFQVFKVMLCFVIPCLTPIFFWNESLSVVVFAQMLRYMLSLNFTWSVNSFAHIWGNKPYDRHIMPVENRIVAVVALGEGWHNYHHTFPWDYKAAELPYFLNLTTTFIDFFGKIGWAYDMKAASPSLIETVASKKGDPHCTRAYHH